MYCFGNGLNYRPNPQLFSCAKIPEFFLFYIISLINNFPFLKINIPFLKINFPFLKINTVKIEKRLSKVYQSLKIGKQNFNDVKL